MFEKRTEYIYDHVLSNAQNIRDVQSLININAQRFIEYDVAFDNTIRNNWNGTLNIGFDQNQVKGDVIQTHQNQNYQYTSAINLSQNNLLYIKPVAPQNTDMYFKLSDLLSDILPKVKIPALYHQNNTVDIIPHVFLDDNQYLNHNIPIHDQYRSQQNIHNQLCQSNQLCNDNTHTILCNNNEEVMRTVFFPYFSNQDQYHELTIAGDVNIIWDACRDLV